MHALICGVTESGKTTLARALAHSFSRQGQNIIVYDPVNTGTAAGGWPENAISFDDPEKFFAYLEHPEVSHAHVFVDEAGDIFNAQNRQYLWLLSRGRHYGFSVYMICQRPKMILPTARSMAAVAYVFRLAQEDMREVGADFGHSNLHKKHELDTGDFLILNSGRRMYSQGNIFKMLAARRLP